MLSAPKGRCISGRVIATVSRQTITICAESASHRMHKNAMLRIMRCAFSALIVRHCYSGRCPGLVCAAPLAQGLQLKTQMERPGAVRPRTVIDGGDPPSPAQNPRKSSYGLRVQERAVIYLADLADLAAAPACCKASRAVLTSSSKAASSSIARLASTLRFRASSASRRPCIKSL